MEHIRSKSANLLKFNSRSTSRLSNQGVKKQKTPKKSPKTGKVLTLQGATNKNNGIIVTEQQNISHLLTSEQKAKLELKLTPKLKMKSHRLLSSKSLSQLVPRGLFFKKNPIVDNANTANLEQDNDNKLQTTRSFPTCYVTQNPQQTRLLNHSIAMESAARVTERINSVSMIGFPRESTSDNFWSSGCNPTNQHEYSSTLEEPNLSPICGNKMEIDEAFSFYVEGAPSTINCNPINQHNRCEQEEKQQCNDEEANKKKKTIGKFKPFKTTTLALRDVKNSLGLVSFFANKNPIVQPIDHFTEFDLCFV